VWPASILLGQWVARRWGSGKVSLQDKMVLELGAGCGLPALVAAAACDAKVVYVTDIHEPTLLNASHNVRLNAETVDEELSELCYQSSVLTRSRAGTASGTTAVKVLKMNWVEEGEFPPEKADLLLGADLVYDASILAVLIPAICAVLSIGEFL